MTKQEIGQWLWKTENPSAEISTMPQNLSARADKLIQQWQEQGLEVYLTSDGKVAFDQSIRDSYNSEKAKKSKTSEEEYISPYKDSMYLESGRGIDYNRLPKELIEQLKTDGIEVEARKEGVYVGQQLAKLMKGEKLPPGKSSQIITEFYGLLFAKEPSHPWEFDKKTGKSEAKYTHRRDLIYSTMITQLMVSGKIKTLKEALDLHPATYGGAQKGARRVTGEMNEEQDLPGEKTKLRSFRDERYRREKETLQKWFEMYEEQLLKSGQSPTLENLEKFIGDNI